MTIYILFKQSTSCQSACHKCGETRGTVTKVLRALH